MKCSTCKGTGKVEEEGLRPDEWETVDCIECKGTGEHNIVLTVTLWDEDNEREITSETVPTISFLQGCEAVRRLVKYAQEN